MKKLLIIGYVWPEPNSSAAGSRMLELIELFQGDGWHITFASAALLSEHRADLQAIGVDEQVIALNDSSFNHFVAQLQPQAVLFDRFFTEEQFGWRVAQECSAALRLLDTEDLHSLRYARQQLLKQTQKRCDNDAERHAVEPVLANADELYAQMAGDDMAQREIAAIFRCDLTLMISQFEMDLLTNYFAVPARLLHYCPFLHTRQLADTSLPGYNDREHFIAIGNFRHEPNWDAVVYLKHAIWPLVHAQLPQAQLHIYGAYPPPKAMQLHNPKQGFYVKGWAENALDVMRRARVCIAPLRFGAGIKGKLMDAMRTGTPSVTTDIGAEAMNGGLPWAGLIGNSAADIAEVAVRLYLERDAWHQAQTRGFTILHEYFGRDDQPRRLLARVMQLQEDLARERQQNFIGAMLRHHSMKSTQYMSQWIEAKNKKP